MISPALSLHADENTPALETKSENSLKPVKDYSQLTALSKKELKSFCSRNLKFLAKKMSSKNIQEVCDQIEQLDGCYSNEKRPLIHFDKKGLSTSGKRILTISLIHGDEQPSGTVTSRWMSRLTDINSRNSWRVIPIANPDGWRINSRMNGRGVDINRNFPTQDWNTLALKWWEEKKNKDPRRFPGFEAASENETLCLLKHIEDFKPDFIISVHTPLGVLDFDGPQLAGPKSSPLPWRSLGNYPGSLGRYMWKDRNIPVLTIELRGSNGVLKLEELDQLQDISGTVAIQAHRMLNHFKKKTN